MKKALLIGCGNSRKNKRGGGTFDKLTTVTLDIDPNCQPDVTWDLEKLPLPFDDNYFDSIHAYDVLEHTGQQGDYKFFFAQFSEFWRILKPGGILCGEVPGYNCLGSWGDPSHKRIINEMTLVFLSQKQYEIQVGKTPMSDYRYLYKADFDIIHSEPGKDKFVYALKAVKE